MAVSKIKVVSIIGRMEELDAVTAICGRLGEMHPENTLSFYSNPDKFLPITDEDPYAEPLRRLTDVLKANRLQPIRSTQKALQKMKMDLPEAEEYVNFFCDKMETLRRQREESQQKMLEYRNCAEETMHFTGLDLDLDAIRNCKFIKVRFGCLPKESFEKLNQYDQNPYIIFFPCTVEGEKYWGVYFSPIDQVSEVDRIFTSLYFQRTRLSELHSTPEHMVEAMREAFEKEAEKEKELQKKLQESWEEERAQCSRVFSWLTEQSVFFGIRRYAAHYNDNFILTGWIPASEERHLRRELDRLKTVEFEFHDASEEMPHSPPVKLKNKRLFSPFEFFVDLYGLPSYDEIDPTPFVALTYILLFGIMFGDLGQGLLVSVTGYLMWKLKRMPLGRILIPCGISSAVFGMVFGSVFGFEHWLDPMYQAMGFAEKPIEVMEPSTTNVIIYSAVGIGIFLMLAAILINIYSSVKRKHWENAFFGPNGVAGLIFYGGIVVGFGGQLVFGWQIVTPLYIVLVIALPLLVIFFREVLGGLVEKRPDWKPESWGGFIMQNFFEVFEFLLSYASNTISFLRVGAFVLVHVGMMTVVFTLADMTTGVFYVLVVAIGNVVIMAMEGLLVGIQALRLEFYEMFSRFFDGAGRPFKPIRLPFPVQ